MIEFTIRLRTWTFFKSFILNLYEITFETLSASETRAVCDTAVPRTAILQKEVSIETASILRKKAAGQWRFVAVQWQRYANGRLLQSTRHIYSDVKRITSLLHRSCILLVHAMCIYLGANVRGVKCNRKIGMPVVKSTLHLCFTEQTTLPSQHVPQSAIFILMTDSW